MSIMSKKRKSFQDKLRRKCKNTTPSGSHVRWSTNTNYGRGTILIKSNANTHMFGHRGSKWFVDLVVDLDDYKLRKTAKGEYKSDPIGICLEKYSYEGENRYIEESETWAYLTLEELELIYNIAKEKINEINNDIQNEEKE